MHTNLCTPIYRQRLMIEGNYTISINNPKQVRDFLVQLSEFMGMSIIQGPHISSATGISVPLHDGYEGQIIWAESGAQIYIWNRFNFLTVDVYSCKPFDVKSATEFVTNYFAITHFSMFELPDPLVRKFHREDLIEVRQTIKGAGIFAKAKIPADTTVSYLDGQIYYASTESDFERKETEPKYFARDHAVPFHKYFYRNSFNSLGVTLNHSCEPNCYVKDLFLITTMRDIDPDEELTYSYSLFCNSDWKMKGPCLCGSPECNGEVLPWAKLPSEQKKKYLPYTADWIVLEEMKKKHVHEKVLLKNYDCFVKTVVTKFMTLFQLHALNHQQNYAKPPKKWTKWWRW